jgi:hypothetical protein
VPLRQTVDQRLKLLSYLHVQLHYTLIGLTLAAILGSDREATIFLCVVENREQLGAGISSSWRRFRAICHKRRNRVIVSIPRGCERRRWRRNCRVWLKRP